MGAPDDKEDERTFVLSPEIIAMPERAGIKVLGTVPGRPDLIRVKLIDRKTNQ